MDSSEEDYPNQVDAIQNVIHYKVSYSHEINTKEVDYDNKGELNKQRCPMGRSGNNPSRVKRVVSCKRKTHHLTVVRKRQSVPGRPNDTTNKENEITCVQDMQQKIFYVDPWELPANAINNHKTAGIGSKHALSELSRDHSTMNNILFGRNLKLKVALTLWKRNVGELLTYFLRIQDTGVFVDFLPMITKSINEDSLSFTIGCCVDLFPLVKKVLTNPYEEYLIAGLTWIHSVLKNWWKELKASGYNGATHHSLDKNFQIFNQQLLDLWCQEPFFKLVPGPAADMAKMIDSFLSQLT